MLVNNACNTWNPWFILQSACLGTSTTASYNTNSAYALVRGRETRGRIHKSIRERMPLPLPPAKRARQDMTDEDDGAEEVGSGLQVTKPPRSIPHCYNNNYTVRLTYVDSYLTTLHPGTAATRTFNMNSIYDPDYTGTGHQPFFRDMWASQYDYYAVLSCDYHIEGYNCCVDTVQHTSAGTVNQRLGCIQATAIPTTDIDDVSPTGYIYPQAEMKNTITKFVPPETTFKFQGTLTPGDFLVDAKDSDSDNT